jgi:hypothetical protein
MPFIAYLPRGFDNSHENDSFDNLFACLKARFDSLPGLNVLVGNISFEGNEMDAVFFKPDGIAILEIKNFGGEVQFFESTPWIVGGQQVIGGSKPNPFRQIHGYRIALRTWLLRWERQFMLAPKQIDWRDINAIVLFTRTISFDARVLGGDLSFWFQVTDMGRIADSLAAVRARSIRFQPEELRLLVGRLGLTEQHRYRARVSPALPPLVASPPPPEDKIQLNYVKEFNFRDHELRMRNMGAARLLGAQRVRELFEHVRQGLNPFAPMQRRTDDRIKGATIYPLNENSELLLIQLGPFAIPAFLGAPQEVHAWLDNHAGLTVSVDEVTGRVSTTRITSQPNTTHLQPPALTAENKPFFARVSGINFEELVPQTLARQHVLSLDETSTETEVRQALELVVSEDFRRFLFDLIALISSGDIAGAEARIRLRNGLAVPAQDAGHFAEQAAAAPVNSDQVLVINGLTKEELDRLLDPVNFQDWMLFLHPDQKTFADATYEKPLVLKGVSGSGKTCILVHRARTLAKRYPGERIGILTLSNSLAGLLQNLVNRLCSEEERRNIKVAPFYQVFRDCLKHLGPERYFEQLNAAVGSAAHMHTVLEQAAEGWPDNMVWNLDPVSRDSVEEQWEQFYMQRNPDVLDWMKPIVEYLEGRSLDAMRYLEEEFSLIRSAFTVPNRSSYLAPTPPDWRAGRTIPFTREKQRPGLLRLLLFWEEWLLAGGMIDALGLTQALMPLHNEMRGLPDSLKFRCLLVDEFQDFSSLDLQLLRRIVPLDKPDALFVAGDPVQKILVKRLRYADAALDDGPAKHEPIRKNYRNSKQILRAASRVANHFGKVAGGQGEEVEVLDPELAQRETSPPIALKTDSQIEKAWEIVLECTRAENAAPYTVCIATAAPHDLPVAHILHARPKDSKARALSGDCILHPDEIVVGTINELKGFEFRLVVIVGADATAFPDPGIPRDEIWREALRLYVAMTRARDQVFLLHQHEPSEFITVMGDAVLLREEPLLKPYERHQPEPQPDRTQIPTAQSSPLGRTTTSHRAPAHVPNADSHKIDWDENCETWFSALETEALNRYFARHVYRDGLRFKEWLKPRGLKMIQPALFYKIHKCPPTLVSAIIYKIKSKGIHMDGHGRR